jgi:adenine deaminase
MAVIERHKNTRHIGIGYLSGYGLKAGAVATSVSHDSHNIICVGENDADMAFAANRISSNRGGIVVVKNGAVLAELPLEIAGLMSDKPLQQVNDLLEQAKAAAHALGVGTDIDPFMTLSFMSLPVIPTLRLTTRGVIDVMTQQYI